LDICFVTSEMLPFAATGGLGEVCGALAAMLARRGHRVRVILPLYRQIDRESLREILSFRVRLSWRDLECRCFTADYQGITIYFLQNDAYFARPALYGEYDDGERFAFLSSAALALLPHLGPPPEILHLNDWHTALCLPYLRLVSRWDPYYRNIATVYTIHNMEYQGIYSPELMGDLFGLGEEEGRELYHMGALNLTAGAIRLCDRLTTVSPGYAEELSDDRVSLGLGGVISTHRGKLTGIVNGIDEAEYDPRTGRDGIVPFDSSDLSGKAENKAALQRRLGLPEEGNTPLLAMVTRLAAHKGIDLVLSAVDAMLERRMQLVVLGSGEGRYEHALRLLAERYPDRVRVIIGFDRPLSRAIYAGADLFLMPSLSEACGIAQMIASRYGALPLVHQTGGLRDTVEPYDRYRDTGDGFGFAPYSRDALLAVFHMALDLYERERERYDGIVRRAMRRDRGWERSAERYEEVYRMAREGKG